MNYSDFKKIMINFISFNQKAEDQLLEKMIEKPERFISDFQLQDDESRFIKILVTSNTIKLGNAFEKVIEQYFLENGYKIMNKNIEIDKKKHKIDILVIKNNDILVIEQKIRDDHDRGKKEKNISDLKLKYNYIKKKYSNKNVMGILYFLDPSLQKNKKYYTNELKHPNANLIVLYGEELFLKMNIKNKWTNLINNFKKFKNEYNHQLFNSKIKLINHNQFTIQQTKKYKKSFKGKGEVKLAKMKKVLDKYGVKNE